MIHRTLIAGLVSLFLFASLTAQAGVANDEKAQKIANNAGCITCHALKHDDLKNGSKPVGPAWEDVALQYKSTPGAAEFLTRIVLEGSNPSASHWKSKAAGLVMPPNAVAISQAEARQLVYWILSH
jgi:cytochrome c